MTSAREAGSRKRAASLAGKTLRGERGDYLVPHSRELSLVGVSMIHRLEEFARELEMRAAGVAFLEVTDDPVAVGVR
jgi:hypothetical protein